MINGWVIITAAVAYIGLLFAIAYFGDRYMKRRKPPHGRPTIYALTLAVYCTSWTFFGSIGLSAQTGLDFLAVYIGPIVAFVFARPLLHRIIRLSKAQNITSIADFIAARYGKSPSVAAVVTIIAVIGGLPYIALQLKAVSQSVATLLGHSPANPDVGTDFLFGDLALIVALTMGAFAILFGARNSDATEHQDGLMLAIAVESAVKLIAFLAVGMYITFGIMGGIGPLIEKAGQDAYVSDLFQRGFHGGTLLTVTFLSFVCIILLPRQFHVTVVENNSEHELKRAGWMFPLYLVAINLFVVPVAIAGLVTFPAGSVEGDMYLLALPLAAGSELFTLMAFVGGLSAATAMVIVATVALSIMVCNDLVMPLLLQRRNLSMADRADMGQFLLHIRRSAVLVILLLAYGFYSLVANSYALASIGLLSFVAISQFAPAFFGGLMWRRGTAQGAIAGIFSGFAVWAYTLLLPYFVKAGLVGGEILEHGPFGLAVLRPQMLFYTNFDPLTHGVVWSLFFNVLAFVVVSLLRTPVPIERLQANIFVEEGPPRYAAQNFRPARSSVNIGELIATVARYLGAERTERSFTDYAASRAMPLDLRAEADIHTIRFTENLLASAIGAASSRLVMSLTLKRRHVGVTSALKLLDDASEALQYNRDLLQTALDHVRQGIAVFDKDMRLICWNRQFRDVLSLPPALGRFGVPLDQIIRHLAQRVSDDRRNIEEIVTDRVTKYVVSLETFHERLPDGRAIEVRTNALPQGGIVVTYMDITDQVSASEGLARAKEELERRVAERTAELTAVNRELELAKAKADEANLSKTRFLAAASHDILQPLNAARLYTTSLTEQNHDGGTHRLARNIDASLEAVEEILNALLDISRLDTGAMRPEITIFPINELFDQLKVEFDPMARARGLNFSLIPSAIYVRSDRRLLRRVLQNLVSNALKYTEHGGVVLGCRRRGRQVLIQVHDTGPGIPMDQQTLIFKEFKRLEAHGRIVPGLGLGLSIVERMCRMLNHPLTLSSRLGRGSTFTVTLPLARWAEIDTVPRYPGRSPAYGDLRGCVVLCLDNERSILEGMNALLSGWNCLVMTAASADEALRQLRPSRVAPEIILTDYHLESESGIEALAALNRALQATVPAVIITADRSPDIRANAAARGVPVLYKPLKPAALRALMSQMIIRKSAAE
jgi:Na+/proline symporter/signal transduction histidine kinase